MNEWARVAGHALAAATFLILVGCGDGNRAVLLFSVQDVCNDGAPTEVIVFDQTNNLVFDPVIVRFAEVVDIYLDCQPGALLCYGARPIPDTGFFWGTDVTGLAPCEACCAVCAVDPPLIADLTCP